MPQFLTTAHTHVKCTGSTNTDLICAITDGTHPHDLAHLYTADTQTAGRGQHGRSWVSGAGNVFLSLYVPLGRGQFDLHQLSGLLSLAVGYHMAHLDVIQHINQLRTQHKLPLIGVKWANDVGYYDDELKCFKKLAGILIEPVFKKLNDKNTLVGVVIGIGLNVEHSPKIKDGLYQATCLQDLMADLALTAQDLYLPMTNAIFQAVATCNACQNPAYLSNFIHEFNHAHLLQGNRVSIFIQNNMTDVFYQGQCVGIGHDGELLLKNHHQITPIYAGMAKIENNV